MATETDPIVGAWYQHLDKGPIFEVIALDEDNGIVEIQHFDGDIEAIELPAWYDLEIEWIEAPEDWTGPLDNIERDDLGYTETDMEPEDWSAPCRECKPAWKQEENETSAARSEAIDAEPLEDDPPVKG
jgi:hypothetical protein